MHFQYVKSSWFKKKKSSWFIYTNINKKIPFLKVFMIARAIIARINLTKDLYVLKLLNFI